MMIFSQSWVLIMASVAIIHWLLPPKIRGGWIIAVTAAFLAYHSLTSLTILSVLTVFLYYTAGKFNEISGKRLLGIIAFTGGILSFYKLGASLSGQNLDTGGGIEESFLIPLGLSYYTFRCIHYAIEKYKQSIPADSFYNFVQYLFFLPTIIAGPIHRYHSFDKDRRLKRWNPYMAAEGLERILFGYVKISFFANLLVSFVFALFVNDIMLSNQALGSYLRMLQMGMNLYFLFAGYTDIAIGFGLLLGYRVMENFNWPFLAKNISDFWQRWHISLTSWCRDYVYMGTMSVSRHAALAALASMLVMGLWHEFSIRYIVWGLYQGLGIVIWQQFQNAKTFLPSVNNKIAKIILQIFSTLLTLHYVLIGMMLVHHGTLEGGLKFLSKIFLFWM
jgi:alginate O-acetyltransferase complex protein AlgI